MKYRTKHLNQIGYFAQVKLSFFSSWKTIGNHNYGVGEYPNNHIDYPLESSHEAILLAQRHEFHTKANKGLASYNYILK